MRQLVKVLWTVQDISGDVVSDPAADEGASGATEVVKIRGRGWSVDKTRRLLPLRQVLLSLIQLGLPAALHQGHEAPVKLCQRRERKLRFGDF